MTGIIAAYNNYIYNIYIIKLFLMLQYLHKLQILVIL